MRTWRGSWDAKPYVTMKHWRPATIPVTDSTGSLNPDNFMSLRGLRLMIFVWVPAYVQVDKCLHSKKRSPAWHWMLAKLGISAGAGSLRAQFSLHSTSREDCFAAKGTDSKGNTNANTSCLCSVCSGTTKEHPSPRMLINSAPYYFHLKKN